MKPRHAAALALVGWYLMMPPILDTGGPGIDAPDFPLTSWTVVESYDSATACQKAKAVYPKRARRELKERLQDQTYNWRMSAIALLEDQLKHLSCVSSDDPRLKGD